MALHCSALYCCTLCRVVQCSVWYYIVLQCGVTVAGGGILHCVMLCCIVLYCSAARCGVKYCSVLACSVSYCAVVCCVVV